MTDARLVDRLAALEPLAQIPRRELDWLASHGQLRQYGAGTVVSPKGVPLQTLFIMLSGHIAIRVDRGAGPRRVMEWRAGDVTGKLPYSRMTGPPGDNRVEQPGEVVAVPESVFPEMIAQCPAFTAHCVHVMLDRARRFNTSDLQDEKMISLGKLAAGLAHELNNPASATVRSAKLLQDSLERADLASRTLGASGLTADQAARIDQLRANCLQQSGGTVLSPIEQADREDEIASWLLRHGVDAAHAAPLADTAVAISTLDTLASVVAGPALEAALDWIAASCVTHSLAVDIDRAATRIYELVFAIKRFTHMDSLASDELVDVAAGLRDTIRVLSSKAKAKGAAVRLDVVDALPKVRGTGGELNQVWLNLVDNALDAVSDGGRVDVRAGVELDRVVVTVADNGGGIPPEAMPRVFDPFFTTKPPGQGTGLGLEIARQIVRRHRGEIAATSRPGRTEFRVSLVMAEQS